MFKEEDIVFSYTTKMAVNDGVLIPIPIVFSATLGIMFPVYFNDSVWRRYVDPSTDKPGSSDKYKEISRILKEFVPVARKCSSNTCNFTFNLSSPLFLTDKANEVLNQDGSLTVTLKSVITAEDIDKPSPAIFIMLPWED